MPPKGVIDLSQASNPPVRRFAVIGGDGRMTHLAERLIEEGISVNLLGCGDHCIPKSDNSAELCICTSLTKVAENVSTLILPLPVTRDGKTIHCPRDPACIVSLEDLVSLLNTRPQLTLFGGKVPAELSACSTRVVDYYNDPTLQLRNAYITAEAALMTAMELTDHALRATSIAILGYGRIGKYLAHLLRSLGAHVTVCARREEVLFDAAAEGYHPLLITEKAPMNGLGLLSHGYPILFNTIPAQILPGELLQRLDRDVLLIDLASAPFGVGEREVREATAQNGLRYLRAPSLPGSYAPRDAGRIIAECILESLTHMETPAPTLPEGGSQV